VSDLVSETYAPERDLGIEMRQVRALQMVDQIGRREDQTSVNVLHCQPRVLAMYQS
jgi:hypothetical protein